MRLKIAPSILLSLLIIEIEMIDLLVGCRAERSANKGLQEGLIVKSDTTTRSDGYTIYRHVWVLLEDGTLKQWDVDEIKIKEQDRKRLYKSIEKFSIIDKNIKEVKNRFDLMDLDS